MDPRFVATSKLLIEQGWEVGEAGTRKYSTTELDAIASFSWPWEGVQRAAVVGLQAIRVQWRHVVVPSTRYLMRLRLHPG